MKRHHSFDILLAVAVAFGLLQAEAFARGFGGGGGRGGEGGYRGGGGGRGGEGGYRGGESGYHGSEGGYHGGESGYRGSEGDYHGGESGYRGSEGGYHGGESGYHPSGEGGYHPGGYSAGYHPGGQPGGYGGYHPGGYGQSGAGGAPSRGQMDNFLGLPTDAGGGAGGARQFSGQNLANQAGTHPYSSTWAHSQGNAAQSWASNHPQFSQGWNAVHPAAWTPTGAGAAGWGAAAMGAAVTAPALGSWLGMSSALADTYDYGNNISYQDGNVYNGTQSAGSADQYYQQASNLATNSAAPPDDSEWMPLGVFAVMKADNTKPSTTVQLAVNKQGTVRGNSADEYNNVLPVQGSVDKQTQRVAWTVGSDQGTVFDTGLYNLTKKESPLLVHIGKDETNQQLLVRLKQPDQAGGDDASQSATN